MIIHTAAKPFLKSARRHGNDEYGFCVRSRHPAHSLYCLIAVHDRHGEYCHEQIVVRCAPKERPQCVTALIVPQKLIDLRKFLIDRRDFFPAVRELVIHLAESR